MAIPWHEWKNIRNRLVSFGRALQGISPYRVIVEPDTAKCPSGYCNFYKWEIAVNPNLFSELSAKDQYQLTKAILVHEAGHRRFTTPNKLSPLIHHIANILEDERIERQMCLEFSGVRWLVKMLAHELYKESGEIDESSDSPCQVVAYFLQLRWAKRLDKPVKGKLSPKNQGLWEKVEPLVYEAWDAESTELVDKNAKRIAHILEFKEFELPQWVKEILSKLGSLEGERREEDKAERANAIFKKRSEGFSGKPGAFDGEVLPNDVKLGQGRTAIEPKPYIEIEEKVKPLVHELIDELSWEEKPAGLESAEKGGKFSVREYLRDKTCPFLEEGEQGKAPPLISLKLLIDHSASLNYRGLGGKTRMESVVEAVMIVHLVCLELNISHEVVVTPQQVKIADLESGERGKALIAGLVPALCSHEDMGLAIKKWAVPMMNYPQDIRLVLCLTDGACNDAVLGQEICRFLRGKVEVIGVLLDPDRYTKNYVIEMFGEDRVIACRFEALPQKLANILRAIRGI